MILVGIDVGKNLHYFTIVNKIDGEVLSEPSKINNNQDGFNILLSSIKSYKREDLYIPQKLTTSFYLFIISFILCLVLAHLKTMELWRPSIDG